MGRTTARTRMLYLDANDTIEEVGITRRQLKYWEDKDLLKPELGKGGGRYTEKDLVQLRMIKRLIVDEHFPLEFTRRLLSGNLLSEEDEDISTADDRRLQYLNRLLDIDTGEVLTREQMFERLWGEFGATADAEKIEEHFYQLALLLYRLSRGSPRRAAYFERRMEDFEMDLHELTVVARVEGDYDEDKGYPNLKGVRLDPADEYGGKEDTAQLLALFKQHYSKLEPFARAHQTMIMQGRQPPRSDRFFDEDLIEAVSDS